MKWKMSFSVYVFNTYLLIFTNLNSFYKCTYFSQMSWMIPAKGRFYENKKLYNVKQLLSLWISIKRIFYHSLNFKMMKFSMHIGTHVGKVMGLLSQQKKCLPLIQNSSVEICLCCIPLIETQNFFSKSWWFLVTDDSSVQGITL